MSSYPHKKEALENEAEDEHPDEFKLIKIPLYKRPDFQFWLGGVVFILVVAGLIFLCGGVRKWDAPSPHRHNTSETSKSRFWQKPYVEEPGVKGRYGEGAAVRWYYWKLPPTRATPWTRLFVWFCYVTHQIFIWLIIYLNQLQKINDPKGQKFTSNLSGYNWAAFCVNAFFHLLHLVQTHTTYDATAQDVSEASSQGSVIMMLVFIMFIEYKDRGLVFGWPTIKNKDKFSDFMRLKYGPTNLTKKYHGYAFAWAAIYTFWYHPMENTIGHVLGFAHTWLIMLQGSLMFTQFHLNKYWKLLLEVWVIMHGGIVAAQTGGPDLMGTRLWPMFVFGFSICFCLTQIFSLDVIWKRVPWWTRPMPLVILLAICTGMYSWIPDDQGRKWSRFPEITYIPMTYYLFFIVGWFFMFVFLKIEENWSSGAVVGKCANFFYLLASLLIYVAMVVISFLFEYLDVKLHLIALMLILCAIYTLGVCISQMFFKYSFPRRTNTISTANGDIHKTTAIDNKGFTNGNTTEVYYNDKM